jgi:hypothetical protein
MKPTGHSGETPMDANEYAIHRLYRDWLLAPLTADEIARIKAEAALQDVEETTTAREVEPPTSPVDGA